MLRPSFPLRTRRLLLRPFRDGDLEALLEMEGSEEVTRYLYWEPRTRRQARGALARRKRMRTIDGRSNALRLAALLRKSNTLVGDFSLVRTSREHNQGEIGYILHPAHWGHGYGTEGAELLLRLGFEKLKLHRIVGRCDGRNEASARLMERLGMRREAHLRENELVKGEWTDELIYAMLASEWRSRSRETRRKRRPAGRPSR
jgi:RimJ/RimL family protein N-acetyltransferase